MMILCLTPWFPAYPGAHKGNFILDSLLSLEGYGHHIKVLVTQPWIPSWLRMGLPTFGQSVIQLNTHSKSFEIEVLQHLSIPRNYLRSLSSFFYRKKVEIAVRRIIARQGVDVILVHTELAAIGVTGIAKSMGIPVVVVLHGINTAPRLNTPAQLNIVGKTLASCDRVVLVGEPLAEYFFPIVGRNDHFRVVHNGFRLPSLGNGKLPSSWSDKVHFISVSNLHEGKGIELNLQALGRLYENNIRNWVYTIVGDGWERLALEKVTEELGIAGQVKFIGAVSHDEVYQYLNDADVFVLPSYREAFGIAYLEAMACGLLTIGVLGQGPAAFINDHETGMLIPPRSVPALLDCLEEIISKPEEMQLIADAGRKFVRTEFTWQRHAENLTKVLQEVVAS
jgi:glycosyltransferase involved in cell wall biosynthesis